MTDADEGTDVEWFKVESGIRDHRKTRLIPRQRVDVPLRTAAMGVWLAAAAWTAKEETDGFVPAEVLEQWDPDGVAIKALIDCHGPEGAGYFTEAVVKGESGYQLHDWDDRQMTAADLATMREKWAVKKRRQRAEAAGQQLSMETPGVTPDPTPDGPPEGPGGGVPDGVPTDVPQGHPEGLSTTKSKSKRTTSSSGDDQMTGVSSSAKRPRKSYSAEFEAFWAAYPARGNDAKHPASQKFEAALKLPGVTAPLLVEAAKRYAAERAGQDPTYTAMAKTWLHQRRWESTRAALRVVGGMSARGGLVQSRDGAYVEKNW
jgi:hypothetical protein